MRLQVAALAALTGSLHERRGPDGPAVSRAGGPTSTPAASVGDPVRPTPASSGDSDVALLPDPAADWTIGDTVTLSGGELVGDQARLTVLEAVRLGERDASGNPQYAFLVEIEGLDDNTLHYNTLHLSLYDDQTFKYEAYADGGRRPELTFGDLAPGRKVKGWLTFLGPEQSAYLELEYSPITALEPAYVRALMP